MNNTNKNCECRFLTSKIQETFRIVLFAENVLNEKSFILYLLYVSQTLAIYRTSSSRLEELFLCLNGYNTVSESQTSCPSLRLLQITDNQLQEWAEVRKFGLMYPSLSTLVLANNSVACVGDTQETLQRLFPNLRSINLNNSGLREITKVMFTFF